MNALDRARLRDRIAASRTLIAAPLADRGDALAYRCGQLEVMLELLAFEAEQLLNEVPV